MDKQQVAEFQRAVSMADWKLDLNTFATIVNQDPRHEHTQQLFRQLAALNKTVNAFDAETLSTIINTGAGK